MNLLRNKQRKYVLPMLIVIVVSISMTYLYLRVRRNKLERKYFIENFDVFNNETNYVYIDSRDKLKKLDGNKRYHLRKTYLGFNKRQKVINHDLISIEKVTCVFVIQVHNRQAYLLELLTSLKYMLGTPRTFLIFSHDYFNVHINRLIKAVPFAAYVQIYYPYSKQIYPKIFPGKDEKYCNKDWKCVQAAGQRNETLSQLKLHWWWKVNYIFEKLNVLKNYNGLVVFLEDDQYLAEDFVYILKLIELVIERECPECSIIGLGTNRPVLANYMSSKATLCREVFGATPYSMGIAFNRSIWNVIKSYGDHFCDYNDYSWITSLQYLGSKMPGGKLYMYTIAGPRVFHIGRCGVHNKDANCDVTDKMNVLKSFLKTIRPGLFPRDYRQYIGLGNDQEVVPGGFFDDIRDQDLCKFLAKDRQPDD